MEFDKIDPINEHNKIYKIYDIFKNNINKEILCHIILCLIKNNLFLESIVLIQYANPFLNSVEYELIKAFYDNNNQSINSPSLKYIYKITYFEYLATICNKNNDQQNLDKIQKLMKKFGNHKFFKDHPLRKHIKIINFFNFLDYLNTILNNINNK